MKKEKTLRQTMNFFLILILILPLGCFALLAQIRIWRLSNVFVEKGIQQEIENMNDSLNLILEKYDDLLYEFTTDDEVIRLVRYAEQHPSEMSIGFLNRELSHIARRNEGIEGITLLTNQGKVFFYDRKAGSSDQTAWLDQLESPGNFVTTQFHGKDSKIQTEDGDFFCYQISRDIIDYRDMTERIGTVILSVNTNTLQQIINVEEDAMAFICEDGRIIAGGEEDLVGREVEAIGNRGFLTRSVVNTTSGWAIHVYHGLDTYKAIFWNQSFNGFVSIFMITLLLFITIFFITRPLIRKVDQLVQAMNQAEEGNFQVRVATGEGVTSEINRIVSGFNNMVEKNGELIQQVKRSAIEQKNAELSAMEAQIDPHFLYNTLDAINWKALNHGEYEISSMVGALADILRYSIRNPGETVSIGQEIYWLEQYISLQAAKLNDLPTLSIDVPEGVKHCRIHKLLLQPFAENAIKHGMYYGGICEIKIMMRLSHGQIHIVIQDNGVGISQEVLEQLNDVHANMKDHLGIANVRKRLTLYYGENATLYFESKKGGNTKVHLFVPEINAREEEHEDCSGRG